MKTLSEASSRSFINLSLMEYLTWKVLARLTTFLIFNMRDIIIFILTDRYTLQKFQVKWDYKIMAEV